MAAFFHARIVASFLKELKGRLIQKFMIQKSNFANPNPFGGVLFIYINFNYMYAFLNFTSVFYMLSKGEGELHSNSIFYM